MITMYATILLYFTFREWCNLADAVIKDYRMWVAQQ